MHAPASEAKNHRLRIANCFIELIFAIRLALKEPLWAKLFWLRKFLRVVED